MENPDCTCTSVLPAKAAHRRPVGHSSAGHTNGHVPGPWYPPPSTHTRTRSWVFAKTIAICRPASPVSRSLHASRLQYTCDEYELIGRCGCVCISSVPCPQTPGSDCSRCGDRHRPPVPIPSPHRRHRRACAVEDEGKERSHRNNLTGTRSLVKRLFLFFVLFTAKA